MQKKKKEGMNGQVYLWNSVVRFRGKVHWFAHENGLEGGEAQAVPKVSKVFHLTKKVGDFSEPL